MMFANRIEYCNLVERRRLAEVREMVQPLQRGLAAVVPARALRLLTWREMEVLVAGSLEINTDVLVRRVAKRAAERSGHSFTQLTVSPTLHSASTRSTRATCAQTVQCACSGKCLTRSPMKTSRCSCALPGAGTLLAAQ